MRSHSAFPPQNHLSQGSICFGVEIWVIVRMYRLSLTNRGSQTLGHFGTTAGTSTEMISYLIFIAFLMSSQSGMATSWYMGNLLSSNSPTLNKKELSVTKTSVFCQNVLHRLEFQNELLYPPEQFRFDIIFSTW
ncbi:hypothetical protein CDAR_487081 [Caerostris darwini]|uniref:Uncharacterized protein n=1 Tax=Caerostris darwini TaxID=1538125 RepID=A0AAV4TBZ9_9ARAC|nr:hypothetical protein CDAR_487081 [Caerostris darwini]